jgi:hypothetical protein
LEDDSEELEDNNPNEATAISPPPYPLVEELK